MTTIQTIPSPRSSRPSGLCVSAVILISSIQSFIYDRKREKREREQAARDAEYHENRMKLLEK